MSFNLKEVYNLFQTDGTFQSGATFGSGHIHDTFKIVTAETEKDDYILQRLNNKIFRNIPELQKNIERVTAHLLDKVRQIPGSNAKRECLQLIFAKDGKSWILDNDGSYWRMFVYITDHKSYDIVDSTDKAFEGGKGIGRFQAMLTDMPGGQLFETIPNFQNTEKRLETFNTIVKKDPVKRAGQVMDEIRFVLDRAEEMKVILQLGRDGKIPLRTTHNDTKFNNILLDQDDKALCMIDLDTVMPGYVHYDFGDAIRTGANTAGEDEEDLSKVTMNIELFRAFAEGYLSQTRQTLNDVEKEYLALGPRVITYTQIVRFLTDYIDGDTYYKIHHEHHNIQRTRAQMKLLKSMEEQYSEMQEIIAKLS